MCVCVQSLFSVGVAANTCFPPLFDLASDVLGNDALQQSVLRAVVTQQMTMSPIVNGTIFFVAPVLNGTGTWGLSCTRPAAVSVERHCGRFPLRVLHRVFVPARCSCFVLASRRCSWVTVAACLLWVEGETKELGGTT